MCTQLFSRRVCHLQKHRLKGGAALLQVSIYMGIWREWFLTEMVPGNSSSKITLTSQPKFVFFLKKGGRWSVVYLHGNMKDKFLGKMVSKEGLSFLRGPTAFQGQCTQFKVDVPFALLIHPLQGQCTLWKVSIPFARTANPLQGWCPLCKVGVHFARLVYPLQGWCTLCKFGVPFARSVYPLQGWFTLCKVDAPFARSVYPLQGWCTLCKFGAPLARSVHPLWSLPDRLWKLCQSSHKSCCRVQGQQCWCPLWCLAAWCC